MKAIINKDMKISELLESMGSKVDNKYYNLPFWFEVQKNGNFIMHHVDNTPEEFKNKV